MKLKNYSTRKKKSKTKELMMALLFLFTVSVQAQNEGKNWVFGDNTGISFNGANVPSTIATFTNTGGPQFSTNEGCATVSDCSGNLLFYTNGRTVYNNLHAVATNGANLTGHSSSTSSGVIIPAPGRPDFYYVFTVSAYDTASLYKGIAISEVYAPSGTNVSITTGRKNIALKSYLTDSLFTEKLTAVRHSNGIDYWVILHGMDTLKGANSCQNTDYTTRPTCDNNFYSIKVTSAFFNTNNSLNISSVNGCVVKTNVNTAWGHARSKWGGLGNAIGYLKASPNGNRLAHVLHHDNVVELFSFSNTTGAIAYLDRRQDTINVRWYPYGIEFSPSGNNLFVSYMTYGSSSIKTEIRKFDLAANNLSNVSTLSSVAASSSSGDYGALQLGPDGNIYVAVYNTTHLAKISNPDNASCTFTASAITLNGTCKRGLPTFCQSNFRQLGNFSFTYTTGGACTGSTNIVSFTPTNVTGVISPTFNWSFGDGTTSSSQSPTHTFPATGTYTVTLTVGGSNLCGTSSSSQIINVGVIYPVVSITGTTDLCHLGKSGQYSKYTAAVTPATSGLVYTWSVSNGVPFTGQGTSSIYVDWGSYLLTGATISVTISGPYTCSSTKTLIIAGCCSLEDGYLICQNRGFPTLTAPYIPTGTTYSWTKDNVFYSNSSSITPNAPGSYCLVLTGSTGVSKSCCHQVDYYPVVNTSADFGLTAVNPIGSNKVQITATQLSYPSNIGYFWQVDELDVNTGAVITNTTMSNPSNWWTGSTPLTFPGYYGNTSISNGTYGDFYVGRKYRITHGIWSSDSCLAWKAVTKTVIITQGAKTGNNVIIETDTTEIPRPATLSMSGTAAKLKAPEFRIYPNPNNGVFFVEILSEMTHGKVEIYNDHGQLVSTTSVSSSVQIDLKEFKAGLYFIKVTDEQGKMSSQKIMIE